jgi:hypothetical protein
VAGVAQTDLAVTGPEPCWRLIYGEVVSDGTGSALTGCESASWSPRLSAGVATAGPDAGPGVVAADPSVAAEAHCHDASSCA